MQLIPLLAYGHEGIGDLVIRALIHSVVWHAVAPIFRGHGILGSIALAIVFIGCLALLRRFRII